MNHVALAVKPRLALPLAAAAFALIAPLLFVDPASAGSDVLGTICAMGFNEDHHITQSPPTGISYCDSAYNHVGVVEGLDADCEWVRINGLQVNMTDRWCFHDSLRSAGDPGTVRTWEVRYIDGFDDVTPLATDTLTTVPGQGAT